MKGAARAYWVTTSALALGVFACGETSSRDQESTSAGSGGAAAQPSGDGGDEGSSAGSEAVGQGGVASAQGGVAGTEVGGTGHGEGGEPAPGVGGTSSGCGGPAGSSAVGGAASGAPVPIISGKSSFGNPGFTTAWFLSGCKEIEGAGYCRVALDCPAEGATTVEEFPIGGCPGQRYKFTFRFSGIVEAKQYGSGTRDSDQNPANKLAGVWDGFYRDGEPAESDANVWQLTIYDEKGVEARHYYLNSFPPDPELDAHALLVQYEKTIVVVGGGHVAHRVHAPQCRAVDNCGAGVAAGAACVTPRTLPAPDNTRMLPTMYQDADDGMVKQTPLLSFYEGSSLAQPWHSQVGSLTVLAVTGTDDPVTTDYP